MLNISSDCIHLGCKAKNKNEVLALIAKEFQAKGCVTVDCLTYLKEREKQVSTFLGNGIVLPHLSVSAKDIILKKDIEIFQFPAGVMWDRGNVMFIAIGVLAKEKEHIQVLKDVASIFGNEIIADALSLITNKDDFIKIMNRES